VKGLINGRWERGSVDAQKLAEEVANERIEPAPGARARVWAKIEARRNKRSPFVWAVSIAACAAVAILAARGLARFAISSSVPPGFHGPVAFDLHGAARAVLSNGGEATLVEDDAQGIALSLTRGSLLLSVNHRPEGAPLKVQTAQLDVKVVGTILWVDADSSTVEVARGAVEVTPRGGATVRVNAGERYPADAQKQPAQSDLDLLGAAALEGADFAPRKAAPQVVAIRAPLGVAPSSRARICVGLDGDQASACLSRMAAGSDPLRAELAQYEIGWRLLRDRDDPRAALGAWEKQRSNFPRGLLRAEADASIIEALVRLGEAERARREIDVYLVAHPDGIITGEMRVLRGSLERAAGDCAAAVGDFDVALRSPADPWAAQAREERAACLATLGR
jgi:hypothetical protein